MNTHFRSHVAATLVLVATTVVAQEPTSCPTGPGAAFGITSYQCANCSFKQGKGERPTYLFFAEPVILQTTGAGGARVGDIIEAVNGKPITTVAGADHFTYPGAGQNELTVRRGRDRHVLQVTIPGMDSECGRPAQPPIRAGINNIRIRGRAGSEPVYVVDGAVVERPMIEFGTAAGAPVGGYGFAVACVPSCTAAQGKEGKTRFTFYKYDGNPPVIAVRPGSPAEQSGLRVGDVIIKVNGHSALDEEAAMRLGSVLQKEALRLTVLRDGKEAEYLVKAP